MATPVIMPKQGQSVETCIITRWFKKKGDSVKEGDILFSYETDKAAFDLESPAEGTLLETFYKDGDEVPVLENVAFIGSEGEVIASFSSGKKEDNDVKLSTGARINIVKERTETETRSPGSGITGKIRISPRARRYAEKNGVDFAAVSGSGPNGRIICSDIENAASGSKTEGIGLVNNEAGFTEKPLSNVRKLIAKAMHTSLQSSAQLTHHMSADARNILEARRKIKEDNSKSSASADITINDIVCWCVIKALYRFPEANSHFLDDRIKTFGNVHLGIAVDTSRGLMVPVVRNAGTMDLVTLSRELKAVTESCRKGNIDPELIKSQSASFTVSNLGNYGVEMFTPVINLPQVAILGVCTIINRPADLGNNTFGFVPYIGLSLTYDHRAIDGGPATLFLREIKNEIEKFIL